MADHTAFSRSVQQAQAALEYAPVAIMVSAVEDHTLLYANRLARETLLSDTATDKPTCYHAAGLDAPCSFCPVGSMDHENLLVRRFHHPVSHRDYQLSGKLIDWDGRSAHIEYILDVTQTQKEEALQEKLRNTFSSVPCGLCVYQYDGSEIVPLFHNPAFYDIMGYSQDNIRSVQQRTNYLGVHPEDVELLQARIAKALRDKGIFRSTYRLWNDTRGEYRWICLEGSVKAQPNNTSILYGVYSDVSEHIHLEQELTSAKEKMEDIINAIPGGVAIYKLTDIFETVYFSDGVPVLSGYSVEEYHQLCMENAANLIYPEDTDMVVSRAQAVIATHEVATFEFRKQHRDGHIVWVRVQMKWIGEADGCPLIHCVFHNITDLKEAQLEMDHLVNSIPGGIASYRVEGTRFVPLFYSDGVPTLSGYTREEFQDFVREDALNAIHEADRPRVLAAAKTALETGQVLDISYRTRHKDGRLIWIHLNGRRMDPLGGTPRFYAVFTGMSAEARLFQSIANETADGIYVIDKENYDLLYANESRQLFPGAGTRTGQKCYELLHGKTEPCPFCTLHRQAPDGIYHDMSVDDSDRFYSTRFWETDWNGIPAYVKYVQDVTEETITQREKERLEQYFQTVLKHLPGGVAVVRHTQDGQMTPEFLSEGFAAMTEMTIEEMWQLYQNNAITGVHPDDQSYVVQHMTDYIASGENHCELIYRLKRGSGGYLWVKTNFSIIQNEGGESRVYAGYQDITAQREEQAQLRQQYQELILQHYRTPGPNDLILGHCNISQNRITEIIDHTNSALLETFGSVRESFFTGIGNLLTDPEERQAFLDTYLNQPSIAAFQRGETELIRDGFLQLPGETRGRHVRFRVNLVETPDTGDITGILTVTDITEQTISDRLLHQLSVISYDLVADVDLPADRYTIFACDHSEFDAQKQQGSHSEHIQRILSERVLPKDRDLTAKMLDSDYMLQRLQTESHYSFPFSTIGPQGDILTKTLTVFATDLRLGRVCLARTDITNSVREQQGLLHVIAYTFEALGFIDVDSGRLTLYTRQTILENLPPHITDDYDGVVRMLTKFYRPEAGQGSVPQLLGLKELCKRLEKDPAGYDFVLPYQTEDGLLYKQINILWSDETHQTVCMVRADVTDILAAERNTMSAMEQALTLAEKASMAKSDFLSSMSHDIRTPMNAIIGMTAVARAHLDNRERIEDCLGKINFSSRHLLSLINDILDMSKIERSKITLNRELICLPELMDQLSAMLASQAEAAGLRFEFRTRDLLHPWFYGDTLRINQILINILGNAIKFTPEGGLVSFLAQELPATCPQTHVRFCFIIRDTGTGMSESFLDHIFEPFTRSRNTSKVEGSGLGLSITKGLVDLMEGNISVESREHEGTTFRVELEFETAPEDSRSSTLHEASQALFPAEIDLAGRRFLVAEDNAINAEILCELLNMHDASCVVRPDGGQTLQAFQDAPQGTYDAILMDIQMPEMNGYQATRAIRALDRPDAKLIPIVAMTANAFAEDIRASLDAGMNAHVAKPVDLQVLWTTLRSLLDRPDQ